MRLTGRVAVTASQRIEQLPAPFLGELQALHKSLVRRGRKVIDLGRYQFRQPVAPAPPTPISASSLRTVLSDYLRSEYEADVYPEKEMLLLAGARATVMLLAAVFAERGTIFYLPDPGYDAYRKFAVLFGAATQRYALNERNEYLPNLAQFAAGARLSPGILFINSPHNPSGAVCDESYYDQLHRVALASNHLIVVDSSYALTSSGAFRPPLYCTTRRHLRSGLEFISLSIGLAYPGLKLTVLIGRKTLIQPLAAVAHSLGLSADQISIEAVSSHFTSVEGLSAHIRACRAEIGRRTAVVTELLRNSGIEFSRSTGAGFVWIKLRRGRVSLNFARALLRQQGILVAPGSAFGEGGEGWVRLCVNTDSEELREAVVTLVRYLQPLRSRLKRRGR